MNVLIETERLYLRQIMPSDVDDMFALDSDPKVHQYLGNKPLKTKIEVEKIINFIMNQYTENGVGRLAVIHKKTNAFLGWSGLKLEKNLINNHQNYYDLGYRLIRKYWGNGYATESALASLKYGFTNLNIETIYAAASCDNIASNKILQKTGLQLIERFYYEDIKCNWYGIKKEEFIQKFLK